ncbi:MAG: hypothetical protein A2X64_03065 [Ignavibacteria bacterium GWF2_33_9]|nr:MAG: hypothetical protein A2X64_03065 [Ignavibacteria bacterium GWF2_33_9]
MFSKKAEIAIKAMLFLATKEPEACYDAGTISKELQIPKMFAAKIMQELVYSGLLNSKKGKSGGFFLGKNGHDIKLEEIVKAIDGLDAFTSCVFGFPQCSDEHPCPVHDKWSVIKGDLLNMLSMTISEMKEKTIDKIDSL